MSRVTLIYRSRTEYPEGYNSGLWGPSGNLTASSVHTKRELEIRRVRKRDISTPKLQSSVNSRDLDTPDKYLNTPGYSIHNGKLIPSLDKMNQRVYCNLLNLVLIRPGDGPINVKTVSVNATHENGLKVYHTHNLYVSGKISVASAEMMNLCPLWSLDRPVVIYLCISRLTQSSVGII